MGTFIVFYVGGQSYELSGWLDRGLTRHFLPSAVLLTVWSVYTFAWVFAGRPGLRKELPAPGPESPG